MTEPRPAELARVLVQVRLPKELVRVVDHLAVDEDLTRQAMVERLLGEALEHRRRHPASNPVSARAAEIRADAEKIRREIRSGVRPTGERFRL